MFFTMNKNAIDRNIAILDDKPVRGAIVGDLLDVPSVGG